MDIKHVFEDSRIVMLEEEIATINEHCRYTNEENHLMKHLLETRRNVLWHLNVYNDETKRLLTDFNAALRKACTELYRRTMATYQEILNHKDCLEDFEVEGKIFLCYNYPANHPVLNEKLQSKLGKPSHKEASMRFMMMVALVLFISAINIHLGIAEMRVWRIG